jgi:dynein heavy chain
MAVLHLSRICRVLRQPRGNALLVGMGGSGRQSLVRLSAFIAEYELKTIAIVRGYGSAEFHEDLKEVLLSAGAKNKPTAFLLSDTQIVEESFLEDVNNILNSGEVPNLFAPDEMEGILGKVRPLAKAAGKPDTKDVIMKYFVQLVRENLHVVLTMSPIGSAFRQRCLMFPSLVNCCTIDWFNAWPAEALYSVAHVKLSEKAADFGITEYVDQLCKMAMKVQERGGGDGALL